MFLFRNRKKKKKSPQPLLHQSNHKGNWGLRLGTKEVARVLMPPIAWLSITEGAPPLVAPHSLLLTNLLVTPALNGKETPLVPLQVKSRFGNLQHTPNIKALSNRYPVNTQHSSGLKCKIRSWFLWDHGPIVLTKGNFWLPFLLSGIELGAWPKAVKPGPRGTETA